MRDLTAPLTPSALRGGSHVHIFSPDGRWVSFTYNDALQDSFKSETTELDTDLRNIGISVDIGPLHVEKTNPRNHDDHYFLCLRRALRPICVPAQMSRSALLKKAGWGKPVTSGPMELIKDGHWRFRVKF